MNRTKDVYREGAALLLVQRTGPKAVAHGDWYHKRYRAVPLGIAMHKTLYELPGETWAVVAYRELCLFGLRIARWVVSIDAFPRPEVVEDSTSDRFDD